MGLTLSHASALNVLRKARIEAGSEGITLAPTELIPPSLPEGSRWTTRAVADVEHALHLPVSTPLDVLVSDANDRIRHREVRNHIWGTKMNKVGVLCFREVIKDTIAIPSPEILLAQMAEVLSLPELVAMGHELCGSYTIQPAGPRGQALNDTPPVTTLADIADLLKNSRRLRGSKALAAALPYIREGSLSPMETELSVMAQIPIHNGGYEIGRTVLNQEVRPDESTRAIVHADCRVPDIMFCDTPVGLNYDGDVHVDFEPLIAAAKELARHPATRADLEAISQAEDEVRKGVAADKRRDRDLVAMGLLVLPVTKYDMRSIEDLDLVMGQVMSLVERETGRDMARQRQALRDEGRQRVRADVLLKLQRL